MTLKFSFLNTMTLLQAYVAIHQDCCPASFRFYTLSSMPFSPVSNKTCRLMIITTNEILQTTSAAFKTWNCQQLLPARAEYLYLGHQSIGMALKIC
jgi:hypothetical protein